MENLHREHRVHPVLVLDEAQLMPDSTLGHLHVMMNFAWDSEPLLSVVLVGLPELHDRLKLGIHRSLLTRLTTCIEVPPARAEQTVAYVRKRLADAGAKGELFAPDALTVLHELTGGVSAPSTCSPRPRSGSPPSRTCAWSTGPSSARRSSSPRSRSPELAQLAATGCRSGRRLRLETS